MSNQGHNDPAGGVPRRATDSRFGPDDGEAGVPPEAPELFAGVRSRRVVAYLIDLVIMGLLALAIAFVGGLIVVLTFGVASPLLAIGLAWLPVIYHTLLVGGEGDATFGMRVMGLRVVCWNGRRPGYVQALLQVGLFYISLALTNFLILLVSLFNRRGRCLHDYLSGCVVVNALPATPVYIARARTAA